MTKPTTFADWIAANPPPDLGELVRKHGSYGAIPGEAWDAYDAALREWQWRRQDRTLPYARR